MTSAIKKNKPASSALETLTSRQLAKRCVEEADTVEDAVERFSNYVRNNEGLYKEILNPFFEIACYELVRSIYRHFRADIWESSYAEQKPDKDRLLTIVKGGLLNFPLWNGQRLGGATREEVLESAVMYRTQADTMSWRARWLQSVGYKMKNSQKVYDVFTEEQLHDLQEKTK